MHLQVDESKITSNYKAEFIKPIHHSFEDINTQKNQNFVYYSDEYNKKNDNIKYFGLQKVPSFLNDKIGINKIIKKENINNPTSFFNNPNLMNNFFDCKNSFLSDYNNTFSRLLHQKLTQIPFFLTNPNPNFSDNYRHFMANNTINDKNITNNTKDKDKLINAFIGKKTIYK